MRPLLRLVPRKPPATVADGSDVKLSEGHAGEPEKRLSPAPDSPTLEHAKDVANTIATALTDNAFGSKGHQFPRRH